jgi:hypothetical protein
MRRSFAWLTCAVGIAWIFRRLRRRPEAEVADPAEELRRKLDEARGEEPTPAEAEPEPAEPAAPLDERRRAVHDRGRASIDEMRERGQKGE